MPPFRIIALTVLALLPALLLLYGSGRKLLEAWLRMRASGVAATDFIWAAVFAASTLSVVSTMWIASRGPSMSRRQGIAVASLALLPALINIFALGVVLAEGRITAFNVTALMVMLLSSISTIYLARRSERKPSLESVF